LIKGSGGSGDFRGVHYSEGTNFSIVIPSEARNPGHPALLDNCLVSGILHSAALRSE